MWHGVAIMRVIVLIVFVLVIRAVARLLSAVMSGHRLAGRVAFILGIVIVCV